MQNYTVITTAISNKSLVKSSGVNTICKVLPWETVQDRLFIKITLDTGCVFCSLATSHDYRQSDSDVTCCSSDNELLLKRVVV